MNINHLMYNNLFKIVILRVVPSSEHLTTPLNLHNHDNKIDC